MYGRRKAGRTRDGPRRDQSHLPSHAREARCGPEAGGSSSRMLQLGLALDLEATERIERIVCGKLEPHVLEVIFRVLTEAEGHRLQTCALRPRISWRRVRRADNLGHVEQRAVCELIFLDDCVEATPLIAVLLVVE